VEEKRGRERGKEKKGNAAGCPKPLFSLSISDFVTSCPIEGGGEKEGRKRGGGKGGCAGNPPEHTSLLPVPPEKKKKGRRRGGEKKGRREEDRAGRGTSDVAYF